MVFDRTVLAVTAERDSKTVAKMEPRSRPVDNFTYVDSYRPVPPIKESPVVLYRPVP